jgi:hypothetical protein
MGSLNTELRSKLKRAVEDELYVAGCKAFACGDVIEAAQKLARSVRYDEALLRALARHYIEHVVAPDMTGERLKSAQGGQSVSARGGHGFGAPLRGLVEEGGGHPGCADKATEESLPPSSSQEKGGAKQPALVGRPSDAPPLSPYSPISRDVGQDLSADGQRGPAALPGKPNPPRGRKAFEVVKLSVFDTFRVRGGRPIGDLTVFEARNLAATNEREARILWAVCDHVAGHADPGTRVRDAVRPEVLERAIAQNVELIDVA